MLTFTQIKDDCCIFVRTPLFGEKVEVQSDFSNLKGWKGTKRGLPQLCPQSLAASFLPTTSLPAYNDYLKATVQSIVWEAFLANSTSQGLQFSLSPSGLWTSVKIKKGGITLYPLGTISLVTSDKPKVLVLEYEGKKFALSPYKQLNAFDPNSKGTLVPYYWAQDAEDADAANLTCKTAMFRGLALPTFMNTSAVEKNTQLLKFLEDEDDAEQEPASKKQRVWTHIPWAFDLTFPLASQKVQLLHFWI